MILGLKKIMNYRNGDENETSISNLELLLVSSVLTGLIAAVEGCDYARQSLLRVTKVKLSIS